MKPTSNGSSGAAEASLIADNLHLVRAAAKRFQYTCAGLEFGDHYTNGFIGLCKAAGRFDPDVGVEFSTYANHFINGEIRHGIREWKPAKAWLQDWEGAERRIRAALGPGTSDQDVAEAMGMSVERYRGARALSDACSNILSLDGLHEDDGGAPHEISAPGVETGRNVLKTVASRRVAEAIESLSRRHCAVLKLYFYDNLGLREIGELLGLKESTVHGLKENALNELRYVLEERGELELIDPDA